jgi:hypothetical protein
MTSPDDNTSKESTKQTRYGKKSKIRGGWLFVAGVIAAIAAVVGDIAGIIDNGKRFIEFFFPQTAPISFQLESEGELTLSWVTLEHHENIYSSGSLESGKTITTNVPKDSVVDLAWSGAHVWGGRVENLWGGEGANWMLKAKRGSDGFWTITASRINGKKVPEKIVPLSATVILRDQSVPEMPGSALYKREPFDNAFTASLALVGMFEVGTPQCWNRVFVNEYFIAVGCLGAGIPGAFAQTLRELDGEFKANYPLRVQSALDDLTSVGSSSDKLKMLLAEKGKRDTIRDALNILVQDPAFQGRLRKSAIDYWLMAMDASHRMGFRSARAGATFFSIIVFTGPGIVHRLETRYKELISKNLDEPQRLNVLLSVLNEWAIKDPAINAALRTRLDIFRTGKGTFRGVRYDLDQLGLGFYDIVSGEALGR